MINFIIVIYLLINIAFSDVFNTELGECNLQIYDGEVEDIPEIVNLIVQESNNLITKYGNVNKRSYSIYITSNMNDFYHKAKGPVAEWGIAVAKLNPDRIIIKAPGIANISFSRLKEVIIHELNHIYMFRIEKYYSMPSWFKEGMAMYSANEFSLLYKIQISKSYWNNQIIPLKSLNNFSNITNNKITLAYGESAAAIEALRYYYGKETPLKVLNFMREGNVFMEALEYSIKEEYIDFQIKFELYLENNFNWVFLLSSSKYLYIMLPIILVVGFIYKKRKNKLKLEEWKISEELE